MPMTPLFEKPEQPRSVNPNVDKEFLEPNKFKEIKNTKHLIIPKGIKSTATRKAYTAAVRQLVAAGFSLKDCTIYGENREEKNVCKKLHKVLCEFEKKLIQSEYSGERPKPLKEARVHYENRKSEKTFILLQKADGTYPKRPPNCGSGVLFIGDTDPWADLDRNRVKKLSYTSKLARLVAITKIQKKYFRI
tara:strand:- start:376 stop:948 length:573 start_codon:yes stop_codon:yes gene_type:complete